MEAECDSCYGTACFKIGGLHGSFSPPPLLPSTATGGRGRRAILEGVEAYNYGCVERFSSSMAPRCVYTDAGAIPGVACYCWDADFCNAAAFPVAGPALLGLTLLAALIGAGGN